MHTFNIITRCAVHTQYVALSSFAAAKMARDDGWVVMAVYRV